MLGFLRSLFGSSNVAAPAEAEDVLKPARLVQTSMNFDTENVGLFLHWINGHSSLTVPEDFIADAVVALPEIAIDNTESFNTNVLTARGKEPLKLNVFMDDEDSPDLIFFSSESVIAAIDICMQSFATEHCL